MIFAGFTDMLIKTNSLYLGKREEKAMANEKNNNGLGIFEAGDREYIALLPLDGREAEDGEVYLYRYVEDVNGTPDLENIESDEEYEIVADAFDELLDAEEYDELVGEDELN